MNAAQRAAWLAERRSGIGSSDSPCLVGLGFRSAADIYRSKVEPVGDERPNGFLLRGIVLEPVVTEMYAEQMGCELVPHSPIDRHPERPWQLASVDRKRADGALVELKTTAGFGDAWGAPGTAEVPAGYAIQCQHQLGVTGAPFADLAALDVIAWELRVYRIMPDAEAFRWLTEVQAEFWAAVQSRSGIGPEWEERFRPQAKKIAVRAGTIIDLADAGRKLVDRRKIYAEIRDEADAAHKSLTQQITALMGDAERAEAGPWRLKRTPVKRGEYTVAAGEYERLDIRASKREG